MSLTAIIYVTAAQIADQIQYQCHLEDPSKTSTAWLALFFAMLSLGSGMAIFSGTEENYAVSLKNSEDYRLLANEALVLSGTSQLPETQYM